MSAVERQTGLRQMISTGAIVPAEIASIMLAIFSRASPPRMTCSPQRRRSGTLRRLLTHRCEELDRERSAIAKLLDLEACGFERGAVRGQIGDSGALPTSNRTRSLKPVHSVSPRATAT